MPSRETSEPRPSLPPASPATEIFERLPAPLRELPIADLIDAVRFAEEFPKWALVTLLLRQKEAAPLLLERLEQAAEVAADPKLRKRRRDDACAGLWMFLFVLAGIREERALPLLVRLLRTAKEDVDYWIGDSVTEDLGRWLASMAGEDLSPIDELLADPAADPWARGAGFDALMRLERAGRIPRERLLEALRRPFSDPETAEPVVADLAMIAAFDARAVELEDAIHAAYDAGRIDVQLVPDRKQIAEELHAPAPEEWEGHERPFVEDVCGEIEEIWIEAEAPDEHDDEHAGADPCADPDCHHHLVPETFVREAPKVGRNDPCPCGSGKKFKKCCGA